MGTFLKALRPLSSFDSLSKLQRFAIVGITLLLIVALVVPFIFFERPNRAQGALTTIRQEINITNGYLGSLSGAYATSSEIVQLDTTQYSGATYYFEVVASTTSAVNATISLVSASTGATAVSVTANGTAYARYRSTSFTPTVRP